MLRSRTAGPTAACAAGGPAHSLTAARADLWDASERHRQVQPDHLSHHLCELPPDVLGHLPHHLGHQGGGTRLPGQVGLDQLNL